jgi:hypothetical protein
MHVAGVAQRTAYLASSRFKPSLCETSFFYGVPAKLFSRLAAAISSSSYRILHAARVAPVYRQLEGGLLTAAIHVA